MSGDSVTAATGSVIIQIGNTAIAIHTENSSFRQLLRERYVSFVKPLEPVHSQFTVELIEPPAEGQSDEDLQVKMRNGRWTLHRGDFETEWDPETGVGRVCQSLNPYTMDTVLRIVHSLILVQEGGFLLHSASAVSNGRAFLFPGVSGAGKSTISRLAPPDVKLLTDEISYVKFEGSGYRAFGTPFAGELAKLGEDVSAPVSTLFFLEQGSENRIETIANEEAIGKLLRNILFFAHDSELVKRVFQSACNFVERVPTRKLVFVPDDRVWKLIRQQER